jgi:hypothetical protein
MRQVVEAGAAAAQRVVGVPGIGQRAEPRLQGVVKKQTPDQALADPEKLLQHLDSLQGAHHPGHGAEDTGLRAGRDGPRRRRLGKQAAIVWLGISSFIALMPTDGGKVAIKRSYGSEDERALGEIAGVVGQIARGEIVGTVGDDVIVGDDLDGVSGWSRVE